MRSSSSSPPLPDSSSGEREMSKTSEVSAAAAAFHATKMRQDLVSYMAVRQYLSKRKAKATPRALKFPAVSNSIHFTAVKILYR